MKKLAAIVLVLWSMLVCAAFAPLYVPAINIVSAGNPCSSLDSSTTALVARMTVDPGCPRKIVINDLIVSLKTAGVWAKLDALYLFAAADSQAALLNWISSAYDATAVNSPSFTIDRGFTGNGTNSYIDCNLNVFPDGSKLYTRNSAHMSVWSRNSAVESGFEIGSNHGSNYIRLNTRVSTFAQVYMNAATPLSVTYSDGSGHFVGGRTSSTAVELFHNGSSIGSGSMTSSAFTSPTNLYFSRSASSYSTTEIAAGSFGASLSGTEVANFYTALQTYMTAVGAYP